MADHASDQSWQARFLGACLSRRRSQTHTDTRRVSRPPCQPPSCAGRPRLPRAGAQEAWWRTNAGAVLAKPRNTELKMSCRCTLAAWVATCTRRATQGRAGLCLLVLFLSAWGSVPGTALACTRHACHLHLATWRPERQERTPHALRFPLGAITSP